MRKGRRTLRGTRLLQRARSAFTLIEVLIAMAILVIGMVGVLAAFASAVGLHQRGIDQTSAAMLAESLLKEKERQALDGKTCQEMSTGTPGNYVFRQSEIYPAYECKIICEELSPGNTEEYYLSVEVRMRPLGERPATSKDKEAEGGNVRFETVLLRR